MFDKFGDALAMLDKDSRGRMFIAICEYGCYGTEPEFSDPALAAMFTLLRDDIDNSKEMRGRATKGGRPKKPQVEEVSENQKPEVSENQKPEVSKNQKPEVSKNQKPEVSENQKPKPNQTKPNQVNTPPKGGAGGETKVFKPPTLEEVKAYAAEKRFDLDAESFIDHYAANGWKVGGRAAMKDWKAAVRNWMRSPYRAKETKEIFNAADDPYLNAW
jgi:outer membrane biosynthesis protein TonB